MLMILMDNQLISPDRVCTSCLMATQQGQPRWRQGQLRCGRAIAAADEFAVKQYECQMGFRVADIE